MPGFTHLQAPAVTSAHLLAYVEMAARDAAVRDARKAGDFCPLGAAALAATRSGRGVFERLLRERALVGGRARRRCRPWRPDPQSKSVATWCCASARCAAAPPPAESARRAGFHVM